MLLSFNAIITGLLTLYVIWMAYSEHKREKASARHLTAAQAQRFDDAYVFAKVAEEYPEDLRPHAAIAQRARIRKVIAVIILIAVVVLTLFRGL